MLADLLGDVRREHAVVPGAAQVEREDEAGEREEQNRDIGRAARSKPALARDWVGGSPVVLATSGKLGGVRSL